MSGYINPQTGRCYGCPHLNLTVCPVQARKDCESGYQTVAFDSELGIDVETLHGEYERLGVAQADIDAVAAAWNTRSPKEAT